jgi:hypothetical protein
MNVRLRWKKIGTQRYQAQIDGAALSVERVQSTAKKKWFWHVFAWEFTASGFSMSRNSAQQTARKTAQEFLG